MFVMPDEDREKLEYENEFYYVTRGYAWNRNPLRYLYAKSPMGRQFISSSRSIKTTADRWAKNTIKRRIKSKEKRIEQLLYQSRLIDAKILFYKSCL